MNEKYGGIEAGGTKFICAIGNGKEIANFIRIPTTHPQETLSQLIDFFKPHAAELAGIGIASFGPIDLAENSTSYGYITSSPKKLWANTDLLGPLRQELALPLAFDTDVNGAALGELVHGAAQGLTDFIYLTIGTGIGGGVISNSNIVHGLVHTELGHIFLPKHPEDDYQGSCPYHGDKCFEGLASGPALGARWGKKSIELDSSHPAWDMQAWYLGAAMASCICAYSPQRIILGGGVMDAPGLLQKVQQKTLMHLNDYVQHRAIQEQISNYIVKPKLQGRAGVVGAFELIRRKLSF